MRRAVPLLTSLATAAAAVLAVLLSSALPAHADAIGTAIGMVKFHADSGDACPTPVAVGPIPYGETDGSIAWQGQGGPASYTWAQLTGTLADRPLSSAAAAVAAADCRDDGRYSVATFIGWSGPTETAVRQVKADNGTVSFAFSLGGPTSTGSGVESIDRVTIQVCRWFSAPGPYVYCGEQVTYPAPPLV
jgi:hypothetical protein